MELTSNNYKCPACNNECGFLPWNNDSASFEICPSCGIQFGYEDTAGGNKNLRQRIYEIWNVEWIKNGSEKGWNPTKEQVKGIINQAKQTI